MATLPALHHSTAFCTRSTPATVRSQLTALLHQAHDHRALNHPYLQALAMGNVPNLRWAIADFARQYYGYSTHFPAFLKAAIGRLECPDHRAALLENLEEESGHYSDEDLAVLAGVGIQADWIIGVPHPRLFRRFQRAMGIGDADLQETEMPVILWRDHLLEILNDGSAAEAIGALGLGTESIVSECYQFIRQALAHLDDLDPRDTVFFPLHTLVDDAHQETLLEVATDLAVASGSVQDLERGMVGALELRAEFWDWMYDRALTQGSL